MESVENHKSFMDRFRLKLKKEDLELLDFAYDIAKYGHKGQSRESGERYFEHPRSVALIIFDELNITDPNILIASLLHDILEDSFIVSKNRISLIFNKEVARITKILTKPKRDSLKFKSKEERVDYYYQGILNDGFEAKIVKLADRLHNLRTLGSCSEKKRAKKIEETKKYIVPIIESLIPEFPQIADFFMKEIGKFLL